MAIFLDEVQIGELLDMGSCIRVLEDAFKDKAEGEAANLPRRRLPFNGKRFMIMASTMSRKGWCGFKVYGVGGGQDVVLYKAGEGIVAVLRSNRLGQVRTGAAS